MKILSFSQTWFVEEWRQAGHDVISCGYNDQFDVVMPTPFMHIDSVLKLLPSGFNPDGIVHFDNSIPPLIAGLEDTDIPTLFYSVDAHHHSSLHRFLGLVFDRTLVAQKDYIKEFSEIGVDAHWVPLWAPVYLEPEAQKNNQAVFVGTLDPALNPDRVKFFDALSKKVELLVKTGNYKKIFPESEIVINQTVKGDLNFRVFEAMMSGALLITEKSSNGLLELFEDGTHLVTYKKDDVDAAAQKISYYLQNKDQARKIADSGRQEILNKHGGKVRAQEILEHLQNTEKRKHPQRHYCFMLSMITVAIIYEKEDPAIVAKALSIALNCAKTGMETKAPVDDLIANYCVVAAYYYDRVLNSKNGRDLIFVLADAYPDATMLQLAKVRYLLNMGEKEKARQLLASFAASAEEQALQIVDDSVTKVIMNTFEVVQNEKRRGMDIRIA